MSKFSARSLVFTFILTVALALTDEHKSQIQTKFLQSGAECIKDHPLSADDVVSFKNKKFPDSENAGCFASCLFKKVGILGDDGNVSAASTLEHAKTVFTEEAELKNIEEFVNTCASVNDEAVTDGDKGCERAKLAFNCLNEKSKDYGFNIDF